MSMTIDGTNGVTFPDASVQPIAASRLVLATAQATTSGTSIDFTGIPSWVKRITVMLNGVSTNGTSQLRLQIGGGSVETSGYTGSASFIASATCASNTFASNAGFDFYGNALATASRRGCVTLCLLGSNIWTVSGSFSLDDATGYMGFIAGTKTTSSALDRVRLTTVSGADTFDAGSVNISYEG